LSATDFQRLAEEGWQSSMAKDEQLAAELETWTVEKMSKGGWIAAE